MARHAAPRHDPPVRTTVAEVYHVIANLVDDVLTNNAAGAAIAEDWFLEDESRVRKLCEVVYALTLDAGLGPQQLRAIAARAHTAGGETR